MTQEPTARRKKQRISLMARFNLVILVVLVVGGGVVSLWVSELIKHRVLSRVGHTASLFASSVLAPGLDESHIDTIELDIQQLGPDVVAYKVWDRNGTVIQSSTAAEIGLSFEIEEGLASAWDGVVSTEISHLNRPEHGAQQGFLPRLIETYAPIRQSGSGEIVAVLEFYQDMSGIRDEIASARWQTLAVVSVFVIVIYLGLVLLVRGGNRTILRQRMELEERIHEYRRLLGQNTELSQRLRAAAMRTTTLNEEYLRRIAAELHDGPAQDIGYALLNTGRTEVAPRVHSNDGAAAPDGEPVQPHLILRRALDEIRSISAGLRSPELDDLTISEVVQRAVAVHRTRTGRDVASDCRNVPTELHLAAKITIYRLIQEALSNAHLHAQDATPKVEVTGNEGEIVVRVSDTGPGIRNDPDHGQAPEARVHLGIAVMRERVELIGGILTIKPNPPTGTVVEASIPTMSPENQRSYQ